MTTDELALKCRQAFEWKREFGEEASTGASKAGGVQAPKKKAKLHKAGAKAGASKAGGTEAQDDDIDSNHLGHEVDARIATKAY